MATYDHNKHDIGILRQDGSTKVGLMLAQKNGVPQYRTYDDEYLATQQFTGAAGYSALPPEKEFSIVRDDWRSGMGMEIYDSNDPKRYYKSKNCDGRFKGMVIKGPKATAITKPTNPSAPTIANADMEADSDWLDSTAGYAEQSVTFARSPTHSWRVRAVNAAMYAYDEVTCYPGLEYTFTCYAYQDLSGGTVPDSIKIAINDGVSTTYSTALSVDDTWTQLSVAKTLSPNATKAELRLWVDEGGGVEKYGYFDDAALTITSSLTNGVSQAAIDFNGIHYRSFGNVFAKQNADATAFTFVRLLPTPIENLSTFTDGYLYISLGGDVVIEDCEDAWGGTPIDSGDYKVGSASIYMSGAGTASETISATDLSPYTGVQMWVKSTAAANAGDWKFKMNDAGGEEEAINLPALSAGVWTRVYLKFANPEDNTAITSVKLTVTGEGWVDDIRTAAPYWYMDSGENFTQIGAGTVSEDQFALSFTVNSGTMWKHLEPNKLYSTTTPQDATSWSSVTNVDDPTLDINKVLSWENSLYMMKEDKPFYLDSGGNVQVLIDDTKSIQTSYSGKNSIIWHDGMYMPWGTNSLVEYDGTDTTWLDPSLYITNDDDYLGRIFALAGDNMWLYAITDNSTEVEVQAGRYETIDSSTKWVWHPITQITLDGCQIAHISTHYQKSLWISSTSSSDSIYRIPLYLNYTNPTADSNRQYDTSSTDEFITPWHHVNFKGDSKAFIELTLGLEDTTANVYFEAHYQKLGDSSWTDIGDFKTSPSTSAYIPADATPTNPTSKMIRFKFVPKTNSATATPKLLWYDARGLLYPSRRKMIECVVRCADDLVDKQSYAYHDDAATIETVLGEAADATWPVTVYDLYGNTKTVKFHPMRSEVIKAEKDRNPERYYYLLLQNVTLS